MVLVRRVEFQANMRRIMCLHAQFEDNHELSGNKNVSKTIKWQE